MSHSDFTREVKPKACCIILESSLVSIEPNEANNDRSLFLPIL